MRKWLGCVAALIVAACGGQPAEEAGLGSLGAEITRATEVDRVQSALYEADDDNCGAEGYACVNGRTCSNSRCLPAWQEISTTNAPAGRYNSQAAFVGGKYVIFGGCSDLTYAATPEGGGGSYDPTNDTWSSFPSMQTARTHHASVVVDDDIYVWAGLSECWNAMSIGPALEMYDSSEGTWSTISTSGANLKYNTQLNYLNGKLYTIGGSDGTYSATKDVWIIPLNDLTTWANGTHAFDDWTRGGSYSTFVKNGEIYVWGGGPWGDTSSQFRTVHFPQFTLPGWQTWVPPLSTPDFEDLSACGDRPSQADDGRRIYHMSVDGSVWIYDRQSNDWVQDDLEEPFSGYCFRGSAAWSGSEVIMYSGYCGGFASTGARYQPPAP